MNKSSIVYGYLAENLSDKRRIAMSIDGATVVAVGGVIRVTKNVEKKEFPLTDPECHKKVLAYIDAKEEPFIRLCMDDWFRAISIAKLSEILAPYCVRVNSAEVKCKCPDYEEVYRKIWDCSMSFETYSSTDRCDYYVTNYGKEDFEEFAEEFLENDGDLP